MPLRLGALDCVFTPRPLSQRVVGHFQGLRGRVVGRHRYERPEDLLMEHTHLVVTLEHGGLDVEAAARLSGSLFGSPVTKPNKRTYSSIDN